MQGFNLAGQQRARQQGAARAQRGHPHQRRLRPDLQARPTTSPSSATTPTSTRRGASTASTATPCSCRTTSSPTRARSTPRTSPTARTTTSSGATSSSAATRAASRSTSIRSPRWRSSPGTPRSTYPPMAPTPRVGARALAQAATARFGANAFPDGRGFNYIIEGNVINGNGRAGGAAINLAGVRESLIQNNLVYGNYSSGIAEWDNANPFDAAAVKPGPALRADVTRRRRAAHLRLLQQRGAQQHRAHGRARPPRAPASATGAGGRAPSTTCSSTTSCPRSSSSTPASGASRASHNVLDRSTTRAPLRRSRASPSRSPTARTRRVGVNRQALAVSFVRPGEEPWVILEGNWWKLNPKRPDFHPSSASALLAGRADAARHAPHRSRGQAPREAPTSAPTRRRQ